MSKTMPAVWRGSAWSATALVCAVVTWFAVITGMAVFVPIGWVTAILGLVAGTVGVARDDRTLWRVLAGLSVMACLSVFALLGLFLILW